MVSPFAILPGELVIKPSHLNPRKMSVDCDGVISREIDEVNTLKDIEMNERRRRGEDLLPTCNLSVWLRDCTHEVIEPLQGVTTGDIPKWVKGTLIRNGPGCLTVGQSKFEHLFDGSALLHRFCIKDGQSTYQCKFLESNTYKRNQAAQRIVVSEFGTSATPDPCHSIFQKLSAFFTPNDVSDNCMISVYPFADELYTFSETPIIHRIDPLSLDTLKMVDVSHYVNIVHHTSHPHVEEDGTVYNVGLSVTPTGLKYAVVTFPKTKDGEKKPGGDVFEEASIVATVGTRWSVHPSYMHTFGITDSYFVIVEQPLSISVPGVLSTKFSHKATASNLKWFQEYNTLIHVVSRKTGNLVKTFWAEPFFFLHIINQYEEDDHVIIDICLYKNPSMIDCMYIEALKSAKSNPDYANMFRGRPMRFVLPMNTEGGNIGDNLNKLPGSKAKAWTLEDGKICISPELLCDLGCETPRLNYPLYLGKKYRYFYAISSDVDLENPGTVIKVDTYLKTKKLWSEKDTYPSEPIFVPKPNAEEEDDGVVLLVLLWPGDQDKKVALVILEAKTFTEIGRTVFETPGPVPKCLHGWFTKTY